MAGSAPQNDPGPALPRRHAREAEAIGRARAADAGRIGSRKAEDDSAVAGDMAAHVGTIWKFGDGSLAVADEAVVLTFSGALTNAGKKKAGPRRIPFTAIRSIELRKPGAGSGYLRFMLAGSDPSTKFNKLRDLDTLVVYGTNCEAALSALDALRNRLGETVTFTGVEPASDSSVRADPAALLH